METNKEQQHTPEPQQVQVPGMHSGGFEKGSDIWIVDKNDNDQIVDFIFKVAPFHEQRKFLIDKIIKRTLKTPEIEELERYKRACESINKDNPMAVAENLKEMVGHLRVAAIALRTGASINTAKSIEILLTKIQDGK